MSIDERTIYELMECLNQLKKEIKDLKEEIMTLKAVIRENTDSH